jgi:hypothetical protein
VARDERTDLSKQTLQSKLRKEFGLKENAALKARIMTACRHQSSQGEMEAGRISETQGKKFFYRCRVTVIP